MLSWLLILSLVVLILLANAAPVVARVVLGGRLGRPIDGGRRWRDGRPLLGPAKTYRGVAVAVVAAGAGAEVLGLGWMVGLVVGAAAMLGDLGSSFVKRRLGRGVHAPVPLLDDLPEAALPVVAVAEPLGLGWLEGGAVILGFVLVHTLLDPLSERLRRRPRRR